MNLSEETSKYENKSNDKGIKDLIKYFEVLYKITDIVTFDSRISPDLIKHKSFSSSKMLILFFEIVLNYYYKEGFIPIDYSSTELDKFKIKIIEKVFNDNNNKLFIKLFDLIDFMFKSIKKLLKSVDEGYNKWNAPIKFPLNSTIYPNLDLLFYITFYPVFPQELKDILHKELRLNNIEYSILKKCNDQIIRLNNKDVKICNNNNNDQYTKIEVNNFSKFDFISDEQKNFLQNLSPTKLFFKFPKDDIQDYSLNTQEGVITLFSILVKLRNFDKRRKSRDDSIY